MNKLFTLVPELMGQMATGTIWNLLINLNYNCVFHILLEMVAQRKVSKLGISNLACFLQGYFLLFLTRGQPVTSKEFDDDFISSSLKREKNN